ncbi:MAG: hypothetical protein KBC02_01020 [Candidatus Pacebacteria bacterium]|nr:hypothetical protein [Candidatus Paceibacterota bacterium]
MSTGLKEEPSSSLGFELAVVVNIVLLFGLIVYYNSGKLHPLQPSQKAAIASEVAPIEDGNGIFYFPATGESYRRSLAVFYKLFPWRRCELQGFTEELSEQSNDSRTARTITTGFILHCREGSVEAQGVTVP